MTQIRLSANKEKTEITVMGHCNAGRINGFDLCCCAVSILCHTLLESLSNFDLDEYKSSIGGGWCYASYASTSGKAKKANIAMETIMNGFRLLEKSYPSNICIEKE